MSAQTQTFLSAALLALGLLFLPTGAGARAAEGDAGSEIFRSPRTEVQLVAETTTVRSGEAFRVGLRFRLTEEWHVYWRNPGDSGTAPSVEWSLPAGWRAGAIQWPYPKRIPVGPFVNFGYEGEIVLPVPIEPSGKSAEMAETAEGDILRLEADAEWLVCKVECIPESSVFVLELPVGAGDPAPAPETETETGPEIGESLWAPLFEQADARRPVDLPGVEARLVDPGDGTLRLEIRHPDDLALADAELDFFPATPSAVEHAAETRVETGDGRVVLTLQRSPYAGGEVEELSGVLVARSAETGAGTVAFVIDADSSAGEDEAAASAAAASAATAQISVGEMAGGFGLAFLGGLLLNLMPCVFPVISLKILGLLEHGDDRSAGVRHAWLFAGGIVVSFWILAALLLGLRAAGQAVGWGFQLQSPAFVGLLALLFFVLGLSFLGVFEIGTGLAGRASSAADARGGWGAFTSGMLATLVATPCTAPFMGTALGLAAVVTAPVALGLFTALGLGMAAPYAVLALFPAALDRLPRPGPWMETLKQLMAFPLFATVIWLLWVLAAQSGAAGILALLVSFLCAGFAAWLWGRQLRGRQLRGRQGNRRRLAAAVTAGLVALAAVALAASPDALPTEALSSEALSSEIVPLAGHGEEPGVASAGESADARWIDWSPETVDRLRDEGRPVYVDFTARWCITCQVNKKVVFGSERVLRAFDERDVALVRADWTNRDPRITQALERHGRSGVPLNVYYPPGGEARILPTLLSPGLVLDAIRSP